MTDRVASMTTKPGDCRQYVTIGWMMQQTGLPFRTLRDAIEEISLRPDFELNNLRYYSISESWPELYCHLVNSGLLQSDLHLRVPAEHVDISKS